MKLLKYMFILLALLGTSCKKYLETTPTDFLIPENYYLNKAQLNLALNGVYQILSQASSYGEIYQHSITTSTDESIANINNTTPGPSYYNATAANADISSFWNNLYLGINRANLLIEKINIATDISDVDRKHIKAEAIFLRAYYYFMLTQWYGDIPLRLKSTESANDTDFPFTPSKDVYDFVIDEMTTAEGMLADQKASSFAYNERVTYTAVQGILARVCLYAAGFPINETQRYAEALSWAKKVVASGEHKLHPDYTQNFKLESADAYDNVNRELMWDVGFTWNLLNTVRLTASQSRVGMQTNAVTIGRTYGWTNVYPRLFRSYESVVSPAASANLSPDLRREWCVPSYRWNGGSDLVLPTQVFYAYNDYYERYPGKWRREYEVVIPRDNNNSGRNLPIIRYADVLLMLAEAENEVNGPTLGVAVDAVNQVRRRGYGENLQGKSVIKINLASGGIGYNSAPVVTLSGGGSSGSFVATATATVSGGKVTSINLTSLGSNYSAVPTVSISGGGGSGASATAVLSNANLTPDKYASRDIMRKTIQDERLRELNGEFLRRQDLRRWGILISTMQSTVNEVAAGSSDLTPDGTPVVPAASVALQTKYTIPGRNIGTKDIYLPIPQNELTYNNQAKQNPGY